MTDYYCEDPDCLNSLGAEVNDDLCCPECGREFCCLDCLLNHDQDECADAIARAERIEDQIDEIRNERGD